MNLPEERMDLKQKLKKPSQKDKDNTSYKLALFSANIKKFLPHIDKSEYSKLFKEYLYFYWMSGSEQYCMKYLKTTKIINYSTIDLKSLEYEHPLIFSSFHFGSFRLFNSLLFELGHKIVIIIDDTIVKKQKDDLLHNVKPMLTAKEGSDFVILSVQDRSSIFRLKQLISEGYIMSVYLDGNIGIDMKKQDFSKGYITINFLKQEIYVKNGISKLAALLNAKIVPVISFRDNEENSTIEFHSEIGTEKYNDKQDFIINAIRDSYKILEDKIYEHPTQWTSWLTLQNLFMRNYTTTYNQNDTIHNKFNNERYTLFVINESHFLFDLLDYKSYPIHKELAIAISNNNFNKIDNNLHLELQQKNIII